MVELSKDRIAIGRSHEFNVIGLEPELQQLVTRKACESWNVRRMGG